MNQKPSPSLIGRKEVASLTGLSMDAIRRNEHRLGLDKARSDVNSRVVRYHRVRAFSILETRGYL